MKTLKQEFHMSADSQLCGCDLSDSGNPIFKVLSFDLL